MRKTGIVLLILLGFSAVQAQHAQLSDYRIFDSVVVTNGNDTLNFPWSGGFLRPLFSDINLNHDSLQDLIVFDKGSFQHQTFIRTAEGSNFQLSRNYTGSLSSSRFFSLFEDFNNDGLEDQVFNQDGILGFNKNVSTNPNELVFERILFPDPNNAQNRSINSSFMFNNKPNSFTIGASEIPAIADVDADGDLDIGVLIVGLGSVYLYENTGVNDHGTFDTLEFSLTDFCWAGFSDNLSEFYVNLGSCNGKLLKNASRHGGANITATDLDCNGLPDLIIGFQGEERVIGLYNEGIPSSAKMTRQDTMYPVTTTTIRSPLFPYVNSLKINSDSIDDFLISPTDELNGANHKQVQYYATRPDTTCFQRFLSQDFVSNQHIDIGEDSRFILIDINGDSLLDILGTSLRLHNGDSTWNAVHYWKNSGTKNRPQFELVSENYLDIPFANKNDLSVYAVDLNNDSSMDLVMANEDGLLKWLKNTALPGDSAVFVQTGSSLDSLKLDPFPRCKFYDFNGDSLPDLLAGSYIAELDYHQNVGTKSNAEFKKSPTLPNFGGINHRDNSNNGFLQATVIQSDTNGLNADSVSLATYLYIGCSNGWLYQYVKDSGGSVDDYSLLDSVFLYNRNITPSAGDINGDSKPDLIYGMITGGASLLMKDNGFVIPPPKEEDKDPDVKDTTNINEKKMELPQWDLFPNPTSNTITISSKNQEFDLTQLSIININGQTVFSASLNQNQQEIDVSEIPAGVYVVLLKNETTSQSIRLIKN